MSDGSGETRVSRAPPWPLAFAALTLVLLTLNPFRGAGELSVRVVVAPWDVAQNLLLFLPFGALARLVLGRWGYAVLAGATLSLGIEAAQAALAVRSANPVDVVVNAVSAGMGAAVVALFPRTVSGRGLDLALLIVPLGWISAMRAASDPLCAVTVLCCAGAAGSAARPDRATGLVAAWLCAAPLAVTAPPWGAGVAALLLIGTVAPPVPVAAALLTAIGSSLALGAPWELIGDPWPGYPSTHLRWMEPTLLLGALLFALFWRRS